MNLIRKIRFTLYDCGIHRHKTLKGAEICLLQAAARACREQLRAEKAALVVMRRYARQDRAAELRASGKKFSDIGSELGVSSQAARYIYQQAEDRHNHGTA